MADIIKLILGEADDKPDTDEKEKKFKAKKITGPESSAPKAEPSNSEATPEAEIDELANLWSQGNRPDVTARFLLMDNETAVKLVFAIGREGALELAKMADIMLKQQGEYEGQDISLGAEEGPPGEGVATTEPASVESPQDAQGCPIRQILGVER